MDGSREKLFPTNRRGFWPDDIEKIILNGLKDFSIGCCLLKKKVGEQIVIDVSSVQSWNTFDLVIDGAAVQYIIENGIKKVRKRVNRANTDTRNVMKLYNSPLNSKLNGMLLSYEYYDDREEALVYFAPLKLKRIGVLYLNDGKPFAKVYSADGKIWQNESFFNVKPSPFEYWKIESEE